MYNQERKRTFVTTISAENFQRLHRQSTIERGGILIIGISKTSRLIVKQKLHGCSVLSGPTRTQVVMTDEVSPKA